MIKKTEELWGITTFFNPAGYKNKVENYRIFRDKSHKQGLHLVTVELAFNDKKFELNKNDAEILIQIRGNDNNIMWQKERLLNIGFEKLPSDCDKVVWIDCDVIFDNSDWIKKTINLLNKYMLVQPFSKVVRLGKGVIDLSKTEQNKSIEESEEYSQVYSLYNNLQNNYITGLVWAFRREVFEKFGFYDQAILGSSDRLMSYAFYNDIFLNKLDKNFVDSCITPSMKDSYYEWVKNISNIVKGSVYFLDEPLYHLWHGELKNRMYHIRNKIIKNNNFNPSIDIVLSVDDIWSWSSNKTDMHKEVKKYFLLRNEESDNIKVCTSVDRKFIKYLLVMINSISKNTNSVVEIFVLARGLHIEDKRKITKLSSDKLLIKIIDMDSYFTDKSFLLPSHIGSKSTMDRLLITSILNNIKKIIYLDVDLIVKGDIFDLYFFDTGSKGVCARVCGPGPYQNIKGLVEVWGNNNFNIIKDFSDYVNPDINNCFNAGVMLLNLEVMRRNSFEEKVFKMIERHPINDQFILNLYTNGEHTELPISWNYFPITDNKKVEKKIIHWIGPNKPWNSFPSFYNEWYKYHFGNNIFLKFKVTIIVIINNIITNIDQKLGLLGIFLRKKMSKFHSSSKKNKNI